MAVKLQKAAKNELVVRSERRKKMLTLFLGQNQETQGILVDAEKRFGEIFQVICEPDFQAAQEILIKNKVELIFIEIDNLGKDTELFNQVKEFITKAKQLRRRTIFIGLSKRKECAFEALKLNFNDLLLTPVSQESIYKIVNTFEKKYPLHKVVVTTMPNFSITVDGEMIKFQNKKSMEMLALLIDQEGVPVNNNQIINALWPNAIINEKTKIRCRVTWHNLKETLRNNEVEFILKNNGRARAIDKDKIECDLYELLDGNQRYIHIFGEKYLEEYSWAEETKGRIVSYLMSINQYHPIDQDDDEIED